MSAPSSRAGDVMDAFGAPPAFRGGIGHEDASFGLVVRVEDTPPRCPLTHRNLPIDWTAQTELDCSRGHRVLPNDFGHLRAAMVDDQIAGRGVRAADVLEAMRAVPREFFLPEPLQEFAYEDAALAVDAE